MKIRILGNTLRFKLRQPEVSYFQQCGNLTEVTEFGPASSVQLCFTHEVSTEPHLSVEFEENTTTVRVPKAMAEEWPSTELAGFDGKVDTGKGRQIEVFVKKDCACLDACSGGR